MSDSGSPFDGSTDPRSPAPGPRPSEVGAGVGGAGSNLAAGSDLATGSTDEGDFPSPVPGGRTFTDSRTVRLSDTWTNGRLRLDALGRYLQDVAGDDVDDAGLQDTVWVVRRTAVRIGGRPRIGERVVLTTFCSALGTRWAERRTTITGPSSRIEASALWVHVDPSSGRPAPLTHDLVAAYGAVTAGRRVSTRFVVPLPDASATRRRPWPLRATDYDVLGHVNNAVYWAMADDGEDDGEDGGEDGSATVEHRVPIEPHTEVELVESADRRLRWLIGPLGVHAACRVGWVPGGER